MHERTKMEFFQHDTTEKGLKIIISLKNPSFREVFDWYNAKIGLKENLEYRKVKNFLETCAAKSPLRSVRLCRKPQNIEIQQGGKNRVFF